ncbi:dimethylarginine dimethylaminohydrolase family protein [Bdellovibrio sp. HCB117]|uniref:dimethylarginine dimethylaminohydrolase family protein n=1 Tax=Bdellovibrio sp. HCB117 TaxID=3394359 RepID=UPI0039B4E7D5
MKAQSHPTLVVSTCDAEELSIWDSQETCAQHERFRHVLRKAGAQVLEVPLVPDDLDSVFVKDSALLIDNGRERMAFMAHPRHHERRDEQYHRGHGLRDLGFRIAGEAENYFEGGDLTLLPSRKKALVGYGQRTEYRAINEVEDFLGIETVPLELVSKRFFHLDLACAVLSDGTAFACREAFSEEAWERLSNLTELKRLIPASEKAAYNFGLNMVEVGNTIVLGDDVKEIIDQLEMMGKNVIVTPLDCFHKSSGSAACLSARVYNMP